MVKRIVRTALIFWGLVALFPLLYIVHSLVVNSDFYYSIFGIGDGMVGVTAWLDTNANGVREHGEPPFSGVCIWDGYRPDSIIQKYYDPCQFEGSDVTDEQGEWGRFLPGGSCNMVYVFAKPPHGFQPTTDLASNGCSVQFGFVQEDVQVPHKTLSIEEFARRKITIIWLKRIGIGFSIFIIAAIGTIWLEKKAK